LNANRKERSEKLLFGLDFFEVNNNKQLEEEQQLQFNGFCMLELVFCGERVMYGRKFNLNKENFVPRLL
jgi:hypothetical protein